MTKTEREARVARYTVRPADARPLATASEPQPVPTVCRNCGHLESQHRLVTWAGGQPFDTPALICPVAHVFEARQGIDEHPANARLIEAAKHAVMEWRLHGQLTDSCRVLEAALAQCERRAQP